MYIPCDPVHPHLGIYPADTGYSPFMKCMRLFLAALLVITKDWADNCVKTLWHVQLLGHFRAVEK